jgi:hypothetical protein
MCHVQRNVMKKSFWMRLQIKTRRFIEEACIKINARTYVIFVLFSNYRSNFFVIEWRRNNLESTSLQLKWKVSSKWILKAGIWEIWVTNHAPITTVFVTKRCSTFQSLINDLYLKQLQDFTNFLSLLLYCLLQTLTFQVGWWL